MVRILDDKEKWWTITRGTLQIRFGFFFATLRDLKLRRSHYFCDFPLFELFDDYFWMSPWMRSTHHLFWSNGETRDTQELDANDSAVRFTWNFMSVIINRSRRKYSCRFLRLLWFQFYSWVNFFHASSIRFS